MSVSVSGKILYRGRSAQGFRDPGFLVIVSPENGTVYLPLKKDRNELMLAQRPRRRMGIYLPLGYGQLTRTG
ncbi:MAG: hypothetical protein ACRD3B_07145 [Candidatus Sulfotelmatobacter sp.]